VITEIDRLQGAGDRASPPGSERGPTFPRHRFRAQSEGRTSRYDIHDPDAEKTRLTELGQVAGPVRREGRLSHPCSLGSPAGAHANSRHLGRQLASPESVRYRAAKLDQLLATENEPDKAFALEAPVLHQFLPAGSSARKHVAFELGWGHSVLRLQLPPAIIGQLGHSAEPAPGSMLWHSVRCCAMWIFGSELSFLDLRVGVSWRIPPAARRSDAAPEITASILKPPEGSHQGLGRAILKRRAGLGRGASDNSGGQRSCGLKSCGGRNAMVPVEHE